MDIVFLGGLFPEEKREEIIKNSTGLIQNAADALQWNIVKGLDANLDFPIKIINSLYIDSYPKHYKQLFIKTYHFQHAPGLGELQDHQDINVGFCNLFAIKHISRYLSLKPQLKKWALDGKKDKVIIAYALTAVFVKALNYITKLNPKITTCVIVPDLPEYMNTSNNASTLYRIMKGRETNYINKNLHKINKFVVLTKQMGEALNVQDYLVMEGIYTQNEDDTYSNVLSNITNLKTIVYTGILNEKYGVLNLIQAFEEMKQTDYTLVICGSGDSEQIIEQKSKSNQKIIYLGQIQREDVLKLQSNATILVNPRQNNEEFTKYSFPSKNLEYLSTGRPVIAYKLDGIPDEYDSYIYYINGNDIQSFTARLEEVCNLSEQERNDFGKRAFEFVHTKKDKTTQGKKIIDFLQ